MIRSSARALLAPLIATSVAVALAQAPSAAASTASPPAISAVTVQHSVSVDRLEVAYVDVTAHITSTDGLSSDAGPYDTIGLRYPFVEISRDAAPPRWLDGAPGCCGWPMERVSGTNNDGVWRARIPFTSTAVGGWHVVKVVAADVTGAETRQPVAEGAITVTSSDRPYLVWSTSPAVQKVNDPPTTVTYSGHLLWTDGGGVAGATLRWAQDSNCVENDGVIPAQHTVKTSSSGAWSFKADQKVGIVCVGLYRAAGGATSNGIGAYKLARFGSAGLRTAYRYSLPAPPDTATTAGTPVAINGKVLPYFSFFNGRVLLQRYTGGHWRTVGSAKVRTSGRYTLAAAPPYAGRHAYRIVKPSDQCIEGHCMELGAVSETFVVTAT